MGLTMANANTIAPTSNRLVQTQEPGGTFAQSYDAAGYLLSDGGNTFTYSDRGRMRSASNTFGTVNYLYNGMELRVAKTGPTTLVPTGAAYFVYDEAGQLLGEYDANGNPIYETVYLGNTPVGVLKQTGTTASANIVTSIYNVHADHLGTPRVITRQADQAVVWYWDTAEAFGATLPNQNPNGLGTFTFNQRFAGQVYDQETGLFQNWNREYNAQQGRYDQFDPIGLAGGLDRRGYVDGNPLSKIDPLGLAGIMLGGRIEEPVVIDNDSSCKLMFPPPRVDDSGCISMAGGPSICIGPGAIKGLTAGAQRVLGNLSSFANSTVATAIRARGGSAANITRLESGMGQRTVGEIAEAAAKGDAAAVQAIKMIKQASTKGQRY